MKVIENGRAAVIIDGQFGSTGKGLAAGWIATNEQIDVATTNAGPNSGHTCVLEDGRKIITHQLPIAAVTQRGTLAYLNAGSIVDPLVLQNEIEEFHMDGLVAVHPRAAVITDADRRYEDRRNSLMTHIASTRRGTGAAFARKSLRQAVLAENSRIRSLCKLVDLNNLMQSGGRVLVEVPQGIDLGLNSGLSYPYCTCRDIGVAQALADAQIHPKFLGIVIMIVRTFPIRVGNIYDVAGALMGWSGPCYADQREMQWEEISGMAAEFTTTTHRPRRLFTFSIQQYQKALGLIRPDLVLLNFVNYLKSKEELGTLVAAMKRRPDLLGVGPRVQDIYPATSDFSIWRGDTK